MGRIGSSWGSAGPCQPAACFEDTSDNRAVVDISAAAYEDTALRLRREAGDILDTTFDAAACDLLVSVSDRHSPLYATAGYPAVTVPQGQRSTGLPVGLTLMGRAGSDAALLGRAYALESAIAVG